MAMISVNFAPSVTLGATSAMVKLLTRRSVPRLAQDGEDRPFDPPEADAQPGAGGSWS